MKLTEAQKRIMQKALRNEQIMPVGPEWNSCHKLEEKGLLKRVGIGSFAITESGRRIMGHSG